MNHFASPEFWQAFDELPERIKITSKKNFVLLKSNPRHPSLQFKKVGHYWSVRASPGFRALAVQDQDDFIWFWIGSHDRYQLIIRS